MNVMVQSAMKSVESLLEQGLTALDAGDFEGALSKWNEVLELDPGNVRAARLVEELRQLIRDGESANHVPTTGDFLVVVDDDASELQSGDHQARFIARGALERLRALTEATSERAEALDRQLVEAGDEVLALKSDLAVKDKELVETKERALALERRFKEIDNERRDLERFKRQREHQGAELELRLAESTAVAKRLNEDIQRLSEERDLAAAQLEELQQTLQATEESFKAETAALAQARKQLESERKRGERAEKSLAAERSALKKSEADRAELTKKTATLRQELAAAGGATQAAFAELADAESARDEMIRANGELNQRIQTLEHTIAELEHDASTRAAEVERIAEELVSAAADADRKITDAQEALAASQDARNAIRTEMAILVNDLNNQKNIAEELRERLAGADAQQSAFDEERAAFETRVKALEETLDERNALLEEAHQVAESALTELEVARDEILTQETRVTDLNAQLMSAEESLQEAEELRRLLAAKDAAIATLEQEVAARELRLADLTRGESESLANAKSDLSAERAALEELAAEKVSLESRLATRDAEIQALRETQEGLQSGSERTASAQRELDSHRVKLSAAEGRLQEAERENAELQAMVTALQTAPIEMVVSDSYPSARSTTTPHGHIAVTALNPGDSDLNSGVRVPSAPISVSGNFVSAATTTRSASPHNPPAIPATFKRNDTPTESSAAARLADTTLTAAERLGWLIDESPYVASTDVAPDLSAQAAFVLQNIDGNVSFADLIDIVGLPSDETAGILVDLLCRGIVTSPALEP